MERIEIPAIVYYTIRTMQAFHKEIDDIIQAAIQTNETLAKLILEKVQCLRLAIFKNQVFETEVMCNFTVLYNNECHTLREAPESEKQKIIEEYENNV